MAGQDQAPRPDNDDTTGHSFRGGRAQERTAQDDERTKGHLGPAADTGDDTTGHRYSTTDDATGDDSEGHARREAEDTTDDTEGHRRV